MQKEQISQPKSLRNVGRSIRRALDATLTDAVVNQSAEDIASAVDDKVVHEARRRLCAEFGAVDNSDKWPVDLWRKILLASEDPEQHVLPGWMEQGFPLGIATHIAYTGVFPKTAEDTASVEASRLEGVVLRDELGQQSNYKSFNDAGQKAQDLLDQMVKDGRAEMANSWHEVVDKLGPQARLT